MVVPFVVWGLIITLVIFANYEKKKGEWNSLLYISAFSGIRLRIFSSHYKPCNFCEGEKEEALVGPRS
jgi:hypothetical protein